MPFQPLDGAIPHQIGVGSLPPPSGSGGGFFKTAPHTSAYHARFWNSAALHRSAAWIYRKQALSDLTDYDYVDYNFKARPVEIDGDARLRVILDVLERLYIPGSDPPAHRNDLQIEIHKMFTAMSLPKIFGADWETSASRVCDDLGIDKIKFGLVAVVARRLGKTTASTTAVAAHGCGIPGMRTLLISTGLRMSQLILAEIRQCLEQEIATGILDIHFLRCNVNELKFTVNGGVPVWIKSMPGGTHSKSAAIRGQTADLTILDEAAFLNIINIVYEQVLPIVQTKGASIAMITTPVHKDDPFWDIFSFTSPSTGESPFYRLHRTRICPECQKLPNIIERNKCTHNPSTATHISTERYRSFMELYANQPHIFAREFQAQPADRNYYCFSHEQIDYTFEQYKMANGRSDLGRCKPRYMGVHDRLFAPNLIEIYFDPCGPGDEHYSSLASLMAGFRDPQGKMVVRPPPPSLPPSPSYARAHTHTRGGRRR